MKSAAPSDRSKPRYREISEQIRKDIESRSYRPGDRLPPDAKLAGQFGTSRLTVMRALRDLESEGLVTRKAGSGTFVRNGPSTANRVFGLLAPDLTDGEVFEPICRSIARAGESAHQTVLWGDVAASDSSKEGLAEELCRYFISRRVTGVFFAPVELTAHQSEVNRRIAASLHSAGIPVVLIDRCISEFPNRCRYDLVGIDNVRAGFRMTRHLLDAGCRRVAFAFRPGSAPTVAARMAGYREALWTCLGDGVPVMALETDGTDEMALKRFLKSARPDGFMCANDLTAARLMHTLLKLGVRVPEGIRMVGINDVKYASFLPVPLTSLRQPCREIGAVAMNTMLERLDKPEMPARDIFLDCDIVVRQSCGSAAQPGMCTAEPPKTYR